MLPLTNSNTCHYSPTNDRVPAHSPL